ncbi:HIT family protein [Hyphococcus lacteus]|uniref:HIT family protein n=1 Tax=Hyphococcus lacteus TaxID=3143536 RepID=A0ABV3Z6Y3_9PROT
MSLFETYDDDNIFAKIIRGEIPSVKLYETDSVLSFMDAFPQSPGHCLVIHKQSTATNLFDVPTDALAEIITTTQKIAAAVKDSLKPDGIRIMQFNGAPAGQTVFHLHFHIIPMYTEQSIGKHATGGPADSEKLEELATKIRSNLKQN